MRYRVQVGEEFEVEVVEVTPGDDPEGEGKSEGESKPNDKPVGTGKPKRNSSPEGALEGYAKIQRGRIAERDARVRVWLTATILAAVAIALSVATIRGWTSDDFSAVQQVWNVGSVLVTSITTYYFVKRDGSNSGSKEDTSSA